LGRYTAHRGVPCKFWIFPLSLTFTRDRPAYLCLGWRRVTMAGAVSTVAGNGEAGVADGLRGSRGSCPPPGPRGTHWWPALACSAARRSARGFYSGTRVCIRRGGPRCRGRPLLCARVHGCVHVGATSRRACAPACMLQRREEHTAYLQRHELGNHLRALTVALARHQPRAPAALLAALQQLVERDALLRSAASAGGSGSAAQGQPADPSSRSASSFERGPPAGRSRKARARAPPSHLMVTSCRRLWRHSSSRVRAGGARACPGRGGMDVHRTARRSCLEGCVRPQAGPWA